MVFDQTQQQSSEEQLRARDLSLKRLRPPTDVPGYEPKRFLGSGAYGEVWVAIDTNTNRQVAIKFYAHRSGLDWSLLSREVEKLAFLSADRYVVQLLDVGWDAEPPYYVMEYIEQGSLEDLLRREGRLSVERSVELFRDVAVGLMHAHGKGVLHCDLKPANVLLDQDAKPRLADFGQSRLSHEQTPALGHAVLHGARAGRSQGGSRRAMGRLRARLAVLLHAHRCSAAPQRHGRHRDRNRRRSGRAAGPLPNVDRKGRSADPAPANRRGSIGPWPRSSRIASPSIATSAMPTCRPCSTRWPARDLRRARGPLVMLGAVGPALVLVVMSLFAWRSFETVLTQSDNTLKSRALESNLFAAKYVAKTVTNELERRYTAVDEMAASHRFQEILEAALNDPELARLRAQLSDPDLPAEKLDVLRAEFLAIIRRGRPCSSGSMI